MAYKYCTECGSKIAVLGGGAKRVVKNSIASTRKSNVLGDDETDASYVPNIGKLEYTVEPFDEKTLKFQDVISAANENMANVERQTEETQER